VNIRGAGAGHSDGDVLRHAIYQISLVAVTRGYRDFSFRAQPIRGGRVSASSVFFEDRAEAIATCLVINIVNVDTVLVMRSQRLCRLRGVARERGGACWGSKAARVGIKANTPRGYARLMYSVALRTGLLESLWIPESVGADGRHG